MIKNVVLLYISIVTLNSCGKDTAAFPTLPLTIHAIFPDTSSTDEFDYLARPLSMIQIGNDLLISDQGRNEIVRYCLDGDYLGTIGRTGNGPGEFRSIGHLRVDHRGTGFWVRGFGGNRLIHFDMHGDYKRSFTPPFSFTSFDVLDDGSLVITCGPNAEHGSLVRLSGAGEVIWEASPTLEIAGTSGFIPFTNTTEVAVLDGVIHQFYTHFNIIRTFTVDGVLINEFSLNDDFLAAMHDQSVDGHLELAGGNLHSGPMTMYLNVREAQGSIWLCTQVHAVLPEEIKYRRYFYEINTSGSIENRYYLETEIFTGMFSDFMPVNRGGMRYLVVLSAFGDRSPCLIWCEPGIVDR